MYMWSFMYVTCYKCTQNWQIYKYAFSIIFGIIFSGSWLLHRRRVRWWYGSMAGRKTWRILNDQMKYIYISCLNIMCNLIFILLCTTMCYACAYLVPTPTIQYQPSTFICQHSKTLKLTNVQQYQTLHMSYETPEHQFLLLVPFSKNDSNQVNGLR